MPGEVEALIAESIGQPREYHRQEASSGSWILPGVFRSGCTLSGPVQSPGIRPSPMAQFTLPNQTRHPGIRAKEKQGPHLQDQQGLYAGECHSSRGIQGVWTLQSPIFFRCKVIPTPAIKLIPLMTKYTSIGVTPPQAACDGA